MYVQMLMHAITSTAHGNSLDAITASIKDASLRLEIWLAYLETKLKYISISKEHVIRHEGRTYACIF